MIEHKKYDKLPFTEIEEKIAHALADRRDQAAVKYPLFFGLAASFGLVATFYGFEGLINKVQILRDHPWAILLVGVSVLVATGTAYRKLN
jgi:hypothetical protein